MSVSTFYPAEAKTGLVKLYAFDQIDESLKLIPLAARRALDAVGRKLSLDGFHSLSHAARVDLVRAGSGPVVDTEMTHKILALARPEATPFEAAPEPGVEEVPVELTAALGEHRPLSPKVWEGLSALDRYVLFKVARRGKPQRLSDAYAEIVGATSLSNHLRPEGGVRMIKVSEKEPTLREATAESWLTLSASAFTQLRNAGSKKGDVLSVARVAGISATKRTSDLIPLCHPLSLEHAEVDFIEYPDESRLRVLCTVAVRARTGVEMEALVGASVAALTVYDMLKSVDRGMILGPTALLKKTGGRSGDYVREET